MYAVFRMLFQTTKQSRKLNSNAGSSMKLSTNLEAGYAQYLILFIKSVSEFLFIAYKGELASTDIQTDLLAIKRLEQTTLQPG